MSTEAIPYADIVILALIAGFILLRLRGTLGKRQDGDMTRLVRREQVAKPEPIVRLPDSSARAKPKKEPEEDSALAELQDSALAETIKSIKARDPAFSLTKFQEGAKRAFEMVHEAFAKGEKSVLSMLLSEPLFKEFSAEIDARAQGERRTETTLVAVLSKSLSRASLTGNRAQIGVRFASEQIHLVRDKEGAIVEGSASDVNEVEDEWVFERDVTAKNPNWKIVET